MSACVRACIALIGSSLEKRPSTIRTKATTPRYWSNSESKIRARGGGLGLAVGRRDPLHDRLQHVGDPFSRLGRDPQSLTGIAAEQVRNLGRDAVGVRPRQIHLVEDRDQLQAGVDRRVGVRDGLGLHPLRRVHHQQRALARRKAARDLV